MRNRLATLSVSALVACSSGGSSVPSGVDAGVGDAAAPYKRLIPLDSTCLDAPFAVDAAGRVALRYVLAYPTATKCVAGVVVDDATRAALARDLKIDVGVACEIPQLSSRELDGGSCLNSAEVGWCYVPKDKDPSCAASAILSAGSAGGSAPGVRAVLLVP